MDIKDNRFDTPPAAGKLRFINEGGICRLLDSNGKVYRMRPEAGTPVNAVQATLVVDSTGDNNSLTFTAVTGGVGGNGIKIEFGTELVSNEAISISVTGDSIYVNLATDAEYASVSTAADVIAAFEASAEASALVTVANTGEDDGTGVVDAASGEFLAGGVNATEGRAGDQMFDADYCYLAVSDVSKTSTSGWRKTAHAAL